ncbi:MAG: LPS biosynthesis protein [Christensenellales bacterium]|jgi:hypothetical protein
MIDNNNKEIEALNHCLAGDKDKGMRLQHEFLKEVDETVADHCPCTEACTLHGECRSCVIVHRGHGDHLPVCFHNMVNDRIKKIADLTEHRLEKKF